jgi:hypothetical protein
MILSDPIVYNYCLFCNLKLVTEDELLYRTHIWSCEYKDAQLLDINLKASTDHTCEYEAMCIQVLEHKYLRNINVDTQTELITSWDEQYEVKTDYNTITYYSFQAPRTWLSVCIQCTWPRNLISRTDNLINIPWFWFSVCIHRTENWFSET